VPEPSSTHLLLIPTYNTGPKVLETVREAMAVWSPVWVVTDGSDDGTTGQLEALAAVSPGLRLIRHERNLGKGAAVLTGARLARDAGFTHLLAFDADGQHPSGQIASYMALSSQHPGAMVFGKPVFPANAPTERVMGRKVANFFVDLQTAWWGIGDSLFGMRLFPLTDLISVMESTWFGRRYDFECEAGILLCWRGIPIINVPTPVRYLTKAEGGVSHYHYLRDNVRLVTLFLRHFPGALLRWPLILSWRLAGKARAVSDNTSAAPARPSA
jgi:glycosyltransferase involved in cell wall biosynthesis